MHFVLLGIIIPFENFLFMVLVLSMRCFDWNSNAEPDYVGEVQTSLEDLRSNRPTLQLLEKRKKRGTVTVNACEIKEKFSFLEYLTGN